MIREFFGFLWDLISGNWFSFSFF